MIQELPRLTQNLPKWGQANCIRQEFTDSIMRSSDSLEGAHAQYITGPLFSQEGAIISMVATAS